MAISNVLLHKVLSFCELKYKAALRPSMKRRIG
jgi:hypothetical protein